jgi:hypothetical protein
MNVDSSGTFTRLRRAAAQLSEAAMLAMLWLMLTVQAVVQWFVGYYPMRRQRAQSTIEIVIGMAVLAVLALAVWKVIGPAITAKANGIATDLNTSGTGPTGTG